MLRNEKTTDVEYLMEPVSRVCYADPRELGLRPLLELWELILEVEPRAELNVEKHSFDYLRHLFYAHEKMQEGEWSYACHEILDVLHYGHLPSDRIDTLVLQNLKQTLKVGLQDVREEIKDNADVYGF